MQEAIGFYDSTINRVSPEEKSGDIYRPHVPRVRDRADACTDTLNQ
jgi:hypothetical protein